MDLKKDSFLDNELVNFAQKIPVNYKLGTLKRDKKD